MVTNKKSRASLTIEAVIAFTCYLMFMFLLLTMVKMSMVTIVVNGAANEAAKQIATSAYPLSMINGYIDDQATALENKFKPDSTEEPLSSFAGSKSIDMANILMNGGNPDGGKKLGSDIGTLVESFMQQKSEEIFNLVYTGSNELISHYSIKMVGSIMNSYIDDSGMPIDKSGIKVRIAKIPLPEHIYESGLNFDSGAYKDFSITKDDIDANDVVVGIEYDYKINLPFLKQINLKFRDVAIEKAWMKGCTSSPAANEGIDISKLRELLESKGEYYVGVKGKGKCYHKKTCYTLWRGAVPCKDITGLKPCEVCNPGEAN